MSAVLAGVLAEDECARGCGWKKRKREREERKRAAGFMLASGQAVTGVELSSLLLAAHFEATRKAQVRQSPTYCVVRLAAEKGHAPQ